MARDHGSIALHVRMRPKGTPLFPYVRPPTAPTPTTISHPMPKRRPYTIKPTTTNKLCALCDSNP
jgi:hypothetical protein